jgi:hypothetical protein
LGGSIQSSLPVGHIWLTHKEIHMKRKNQGEIVETSLLQGEPVLVEPLEPQPAKVRRSWSARLDGSKDETLRVFTVAKRDGATTYAIHTTGPKGKRVSKRGMTSSHSDVAAARAAADRLIADAEKNGWKRAQRGGGFVAKEDAFSQLPKPAKPK